MNHAENPTTIWKKCSACKKEIGFGSRYYVCSVSTCNGQRTGYVFCSVDCFERHLPGARHKDAAAIEKTSETAPGAAQVQQRILVRAGLTSAPAAKQLPREILVIASRFKEYITAKSDMNTSGDVMEILSDHLRELADQAIDNARAEGRKTVLERDLGFLKK